MNWKNSKDEKKEWECPPPLDGENTYEVSHIVAQSGNMFCIRWTGYGPDDDSWMSREALGEGARLLIAEWDRMQNRIDQGLESRSKWADARRKPRKTI